MTKILNNQKAVTLIEMLATIVVGSIVTMILLQILSMSTNVKTQLEMENRMLDESYYIAEQIRFNIFQLDPQEVELIEDSSSQTIIHIKHLYGFTTNDENEIVPDYSSAQTDVLRLEKTNDGSSWNLYYTNSEGTIQLNNDSMFIDPATTLSLVSIGTCDLSTQACDQGIIKISLAVSNTLANGTVLLPQTYQTTILV